MNVNFVNASHFIKLYFSKVIMTSLVNSQNICLSYIISQKLLTISTIILFQISNGQFVAVLKINLGYVHTAGVAVPFLHDL